MFALRDVMRNASPLGAFADFMQVYRQAGKNRWWITLLSAAVTFSLFWSLTHKTWKGARPLPKITYITTFAPDRTEGESLAFRQAMQKEREAREAAYAAADAEGRRLYKEIGRASGFDVDKIEARAMRERAAAAAADEAQAEAILKRASPEGTAPVGQQ